MCVNALVKVQCYYQYAKILSSLGKYFGNCGWRPMKTYPYVYYFDCNQRLDVYCGLLQCRATEKELYLKRNLLINSTRNVEENICSSAQYDVGEQLSIRSSQYECIYSKVIKLLAWLIVLYTCTTPGIIQCKLRDKNQFYNDCCAN